MRFIYEIPFRKHISPYLIRHEILNMAERRLLHLYNFILKILKTGEPIYLKFKLEISEHIYNNRHINFIIPRFCSYSYKTSFSYLAPKHLNDLSDSIKQSIYSSSLKALSTTINKLLLDNRRL